jgi:DNA modification methylase
MEEQMTFEFEKRKPIKGYPELHWTGKRPYTSTQYYPAQLKESYGERKDGWMNKIFWGDNLQVMSHLLKDYRGKVQLIYIDPPFDSKADYKKKIKVKGQNVTGDTSSFEEKQYSDLWTNDEFLQFMYERLILMKELLAEDGSIYVHLDEKRAHYIKVIMDDIFGSDNFRREIIWDITVLSGFKVSAMNWIRGHDVILYYSKTGNPIFNKLRQPHTQDYIDMFNKVDENGERYMVAHGTTRYLKDVLNKGKPYGDVWDDLLSYQVLQKQLKEVRNMEQLDELLTATKEVQNISNVWDNIMSFQQQPTSAENCGYPTQKPESLLERIINASSNPGDLVFDCFMGSGTTPTVAMRLGRKFIGADINLGSIQTTVKRLLETAKTCGEDCFTGFDFYNVNNYEFFRNPVEAKELILDALGVQKFDSSSVYDGEKDGWMVKLMPSNRIATKADLEELKANIPYSTWEKRKEENPGAPVEKIKVVCMGHEADLKASLEQDLSAYKLEIEVVDILRDKKDLQFKRDADAEIIREGNKLVIKAFYPMNLLQKLSLQKETVDDWKQLVESVFIDWNYDGKTMHPAVCDITSKDEIVSGVYDIPDGATNIKVKITDLLSESLEMEV